MIKYNIIVNDMLCKEIELKQYRYPRSRRSRIRQKWFRDERNYRFVENHRIFVDEDNIIVSQKIYDNYIYLKDYDENEKLFKDKIIKLFLKYK